MIETAVSTERRLPDPALCRTRYLGQDLPFSDCLVENPDSCKYALRFPHCVSCSHPDRRKFEPPRKPLQAFLQTVLRLGRKRTSRKPN
jgi:hypothetical protein